MLKCWKIGAAAAGPLAAGAGPGEPERAKARPVFVRDSRATFPFFTEILAVFAESTPQSDSEGVRPSRTVAASPNRWLEPTTLGDIGQADLGAGLASKCWGTYETRPHLLIDRDSPAAFRFSLKSWKFSRDRSPTPLRAQAPPHHELPNLKSFSSTEDRP